MSTAATLWAPAEPWVRAEPWYAGDETPSPTPTVRTYYVTAEHRTLEARR